MIMVTGQQPCTLEGQPALGLEIGALGTGPVAARVVPDTGDVAIGARLDMTAQGGCPALHEGVRGSAYVGRQGMTLLIDGKGVLEDRLERDERHRCLRTRGRRLSSGCFLQYHASYPRDKRLVQARLSRIPDYAAYQEHMTQWCTFEGVHRDIIRGRLGRPAGDQGQ